jgi:hypothetical protein
MAKAAPEVATAAATNLAAPVAAATGPARQGVLEGWRRWRIRCHIAAGAIVINGAGKNSEEIAQEVINNSPKDVLDQEGPGVDCLIWPQ